jgi:TatD DNase family protein
MDYAYTFGDASTIYLNVTNRCTNRCTCVGRYAPGLGSGRRLRGGPEPDLDALLASIEACRDRERIRDLEEIVWCGFGEPTFRLDLIVAASTILRRDGVPSIRLNTNGHACRIHGRDVLPELGDAVDVVSVSLNAPTAERYVELCRPDPAAASCDRPSELWDAMLDFVARAPRHVREVRASVVEAALDDDEVAACRALARSLGCSTLLLR